MQQNRLNTIARPLMGRVEETCARKLTDTFTAVYIWWLIMSGYPRDRFPLVQSSRLIHPLFLVPSRRRSLMISGV